MIIAPANRVAACWAQSKAEAIATSDRCVLWHLTQETPLPCQRLCRSCKIGQDFLFISKTERVSFSRALPFCLVGKFLLTSLPSLCYSHFLPLEGGGIQRSPIHRAVSREPNIFPCGPHGPHSDTCSPDTCSEVGEGWEIWGVRLAIWGQGRRKHPSGKQAMHAASSLWSLSSVIQSSDRTLDR